MLWLRRNILLVIGALVATGLLAAAILYLLQGLQHEGEMAQELNGLTEELQRLNSLQPYPSEANIKLTGQNSERLKSFMADAEKMLHAAPTPELDDAKFRALLDNTIFELNREASNATVTIPPTYLFTFAAQKARLRYAAGSVEQLYHQIEDIKSICNVLFQSKVHSLDGLKRAPVSFDDPSGGDYVEQRIKTNSFGVVVPYEITFRSFSSELAAVLNGLARTPEFMIVKTLKVEPTEGGRTASTETTPMTPTPAAAAAPPQPTKAGAKGTTKGATPTVVVKPVPTTVLDERPLRITIFLEVIRPLNPAK